VLGTVLNSAAVLAGTAVGVAVGGRFPERLRATVIDVLGLFVAVLGIANALETFGPELAAVAGRGAALLVLGSLLVGGALGELADLDGRLARLGDRLQERVAARRGSTGDGTTGQRIGEGFVVASLVFCVGPLAVLGPLQNGVEGSIELLAVKSALDGVTSIAFASALGLGVGLSVVPLLAWQGGIAVLGGTLGTALSEPMISAMNAVGGVLVLAIALRLLRVREIRVANLLPALVLAPLAVALWP